MKTINLSSKLLAMLVVFMLSLFSNGCSEDKTEKAAPAKSAVTGTDNKSHKLSHVEPGEASDSVKHKFVKDFSARCVSRELKNSVNPDNDQKRLEENCDCIANHISDNLADVDAEKYLQLHEDTQTLDIKFDTAAYFCLQSKPQPKGPHLFGRQDNKVN